jgi:diaminopimelate epimerase
VNNSVKRTEYYRLHIQDDNFKVGLSPIHSAEAKAQAEAEALQTIAVLQGNLHIIMFVCDEINDTDVQKWTDYLQNSVKGFHREFPPSRYWEDASGAGHENE